MKKFILPFLTVYLFYGAELIASEDRYSCQKQLPVEFQAEFKLYCDNSDSSIIYFVPFSLALAKNETGEPDAQIVRTADDIFRVTFRYATGPYHSNLKRLRSAAEKIGKKVVLGDIKITEQAFWTVLHDESIGDYLMGSVKASIQNESIVAEINFLVSENIFTPIKENLSEGQAWESVFIAHLKWKSNEYGRFGAIGLYVDCLTISEDNKVNWYVESDGCRAKYSLD